jgi:hypothetical protein
MMPKKKMRRGSKAPAFQPDPLIPLIRTARQQIEAAPGGPLGWLLDFTRRDGAKWLPSDVDGHGYRLLALVYEPFPPGLLQRGRGRIPPLSPLDVETTRAELADFFRKLVTAPVGELVPVPTDGLKESLMRTAPPGVKPAHWGISRDGNRRTRLFQTVKELVFEQDRLIACPECGEPFLALRKRKFCRSECLQKHHDRIKIAKRKKGAR